MDEQVLRSTANSGPFVRYIEQTQIFPHFRLAMSTTFRIKGRKNARMTFEKTLSFSISAFMVR